MRKTSLILCVLMLAAIIASGAEQDRPWKKIGESDGITRYVRPSLTSSINEVKAVGIINSPIAAVEAVLRDVKAETRYAFLCIEAHAVDLEGHANTPDSFYIYNRTDMPFPASDRDAVANISFLFNKDTGVITATGTVIPSSYQKNKNVVRMITGWNRFTLTPVGGESTLMEYVIAANPAGNLPGLLVNMLSRTMPANTIKKIRVISREEPYSKAQKVLTQTK
jgi:hypothetical protein